MRILFVVSTLSVGGAETQVVEMSRMLSARGHPVTIYALRDVAPLKSRLEGSGVRVLTGRKRSNLDLRLIGALRRHIREWRPDIVHGFLFDADFFSRLAARGLGIVVLNSERNHAWNWNRKQHLAHFLTKGLVDGVVANTHSGKAFAERLYGLPPDRVEMVWNGIDISAVGARLARCRVDYRERLFPREDCRIACMVATIKLAKDYGLAVQVAASLLERDPRWRVVFVGDTPYGDTGDYKDKVMSAHGRLAAPERVRFLGHRDDALEIMHASDVCFLTSRNEGFPNVVLEAMAVGTPMVTSDVSDMRQVLPLPWQVVTERTGEAFAQTLIRAYQDREHVTAEQTRWLRRHGALEMTVTNLERVYRKYLALRDAASVREAH